MHAQGEQATAAAAAVASPQATKDAAATKDAGAGASAASEPATVAPASDAEKKPESGTGDTEKPGFFGKHHSSEKK